MIQFSGRIWLSNKDYVIILELWSCHFILICMLKVLALVSFILCNLVLCKTEENNLPEIKTIFYLQFCFKVGWAKLVSDGHSHHEYHTNEIEQKIICIDITVQWWRNKNSLEGQEPQRGALSSAATLDTRGFANFAYSLWLRIKFAVV